MDKPRRLVSLDFVRTVSTFLIVLYHFNIQLGLHQIAGGPILIQEYGRENIGSLGITLFIILSAVGLMWSSMAEFDLKKFYLKRAARIYPIYHLAYALTFLLLFYVWGAWPLKNSIRTFPLTLLGLDGFLYDMIPNCYLCGEWFIGFILIYYAVFPCLRKFVLWENAKGKAVVYALLAVAYIFLVRTNALTFMDMTRDPIIRLPEFLFGMEWACYKKKERRRTVMRILRICISAGAFLLFIRFPLDISHAVVAAVCGIALFLLLTDVYELLEPARGGAEDF